EKWSLIHALPSAIRPQNRTSAPRTETPTSAPCGTISAPRRSKCWEARQRSKTLGSDCNRLGDRIARGWLAGVRVGGEHCEGSDTSAAPFRNCLEGLARLVVRLD